MNQDFFIPSSAGIARRLVKLSTMTHIDLDPAIVELAKTDFLIPTDFEKYNLSAAQMGIVQSLYDNDFRAIVPGDFRLTAQAVLIAAMEKKVFPVFVITASRGLWGRIARETGFPLSELHVFEFNKLEEFEPSVFKDRRHGLMLIENGYGADRWHATAHYCLDFQKTILLAPTNNIKSFHEAAHHLFPRAPTDLLANIGNGLLKRKLFRLGFMFDDGVEVEDLAFLFNIITDLNTDENKPVEAPEVIEEESEDLLDFY